MQHACLALGLALAASGPSADGLDAVRAVLQRTEGAKAASDDVLVRRLVALGPSIAPALFTLVTGAGVEVLLVPDDSPESWLCPPDRVGPLALSALAELPSEPVLDVLRAQEAQAPERGVRVAELEVLGALHNARGLPLFFQIVHALGDELEQRSVRAPASDALVAILRADLQSFHALEGLASAAPLSEQLFVCEALSASGRPEACNLLRGLVGHGAELDLAAIEGLGELVRLYPWRMQDDVAATLRKTLEASDARLRATGARALGRIRDPLAITALVDCLKDGDRSVVRAALWALRECSGRHELVEAADWKRWLDAEHEWWRERGAPALAHLDPKEPGTLVDGLREFLAHPLAARQVADGLAGTLDRLDPAGQALVCRTLAQLGARSAVPALIEQLSSSEPSVRNAAWDALRVLTGADLPAEPRVWEEYAFG